MHLLFSIFLAALFTVSCELNSAQDGDDSCEGEGEGEGDPSQQCNAQGLSTDRDQEEDEDDDLSGDSKTDLGDDENESEADESSNDPESVGGGEGDGSDGSSSPSTPPAPDSDGDGYADSVDQCNGSDDALIGTRYKDTDADGLIVASISSSLCADDATYTISSDDVTPDQIRFPDDDDSVAETDFEGYTTTEQELGEDFDGDSISDETDNIYIISNPVQWLGFTGACSFGSNYACSYNVMIITDLDFSVRDGTSGDKTSGDGRYTSTSIQRVLAGNTSSTSYYFRGIVDGRDNSIRNFDIDLSAETGVNKGCGTHSACNKVGGVAGVCYGCKIRNLAFSGNVSGGSNVGGFVGYVNQATTLSSLSYSGVISTNNGKVGGIVGETLGSVVISNTSVGGSITSSFSNSVGGILGYGYRGAQIKRSRNTASVSASGAEVGGIVGYMSDDPGEDSIVTESYNTGNISGSLMVGGIVGEVRHGSTVTDNYNLGNVTSSQNFTGGVVGYLIVGTAHRNYNIGNVINTNSTSGEGVIGSISSTSSNDNYYLTGRTDSDGDGEINVTDVDTDAGSPAATALSEANLKKEATFTNFNFGTCSNGSYSTKTTCEANSETWTQIWTISEDTSYPYLYGNQPDVLPGI